MNRKKIILGIAIFIFAGLMIYTFANPADTGLEGPGTTNPTTTQATPNDNPSGEDGNDGADTNPGDDEETPNLDGTPNGNGGNQGGNGNNTGTIVVTEEEWLSHLSWSPAAIAALRFEGNPDKEGKVIITKLINGKEVAKTAEPIDYLNFKFKIEGKDSQNKPIKPITVAVNPSEGKKEITLPFGTYTITEISENSYYKFDSFTLNGTLPIKEETLDFIVRKNLTNEIVANNVGTTLTVEKNSENLTSGLATYKAGDRINYRITVTNTGDVTAKDVVVRDLLPAGKLEDVKVLSVSSVSPVDTYENNLMTFKPFDLKASASKVFIITAIIASDVEDGTTILNQVTAEGKNTNKAYDKEEDAVINDPRLKLTKTSSANTEDENGKAIPGIVVPGQVVTYKISIENIMNGKTKGTAHNVTLVDELSDDVTYVGGTAVGCVYNEATHTIEWESAKTIPSNSAPLECIFSVKVKDTVTNLKTIKNAATVYYYSENEPKKELYDKDEVSDVVNMPIISVEKFHENEINAGGFVQTELLVKRDNVITYQLVVNNDGSIAAHGVVVKDKLALDKVEYIGEVTGGTAVLEGDTLIWTVGTVEPGTPMTLTFKVKVKNTASAGDTVKNFAKLQYNKPSTPNDNTNSVNGADSNEVVDKVVVPVITARKSSKVVGKSGNEVTYGDLIKYTIIITNTSDVVSNPIDVYDFIPEGTEYVSGGEGITYDNDAKKNKVTFEQFTLAKGKDKELTFTVKVTTKDGDSVGKYITNVAYTECGVKSNEVKNPIIRNITITKTDIVPTNIIVLLDTSRSMEQSVDNKPNPVKFRGAKAAAKKFIENAYDLGGENVEVSLVTFDYVARSSFEHFSFEDYSAAWGSTYRADWTDSDTKNNAKWRGLKTTHTTDVYGALLKAEDLLKDTNVYRNIIVFIGDGQPHCNNASNNTNLTAAQRKEIQQWICDGNNEHKDKSNYVFKDSAIVTQANILKDRATIFSVAYALTASNVGPEEIEFATKLLEEIASDASPKLNNTYFNASDADLLGTALGKVFEELKTDPKIETIYTPVHTFDVDLTKWSNIKLIIADDTANPYLIDPTNLGNSDEYEHLGLTYDSVTGKLTIDTTQYPLDESIELIFIKK